MFQESSSYTVVEISWLHQTRGGYGISSERDKYLLVASKCASHEE